MFFILGAGASKDSGLPTYRGNGGIYNEISDIESKLHIRNLYNDNLKDVWTFLHPLYQNIKDNKPGKTYQLIKELGDKYPNSFILTQNIDGYADSTGLPVVEIHGSYKTMTCIKCYTCMNTNENDPTCLCESICRPNITLFGEILDKRKVQEVYNNIKFKDYIVIVGTTLEFPYLRTFIGKAKSRGAKVIHINPDPDYGSNVRNGETWIKDFASNGLQKLLSGISNL
ncbi:Sir2 (NAD-dependent deacetylase) [Orpheovirus IHUMI-LCC2]|uniref:NAD-dependent protein deacetylase, SIR2 family n=1 Tax=Orpheovirus IHUMI-LCC2 TaxID=2023057 RepID=A0A2I2L319_9VIRU|nr:Sir2 (NAD-dependent deacetylase) [Orpheovirus IHUMI-LCC2]SNW61921.1 NAD-dependent protein deacetylase, SIR2 family [Orpheovirus IHUMI-LCC2]